MIIYNHKRKKLGTLAYIPPSKHTCSRFHESFLYNKPIELSVGVSLMGKKEKNYSKPKGRSLSKERIKLTEFYVKEVASFNDKMEFLLTDKEGKFKVIGLIRVGWDNAALISWDLQ